MKTCSRCILQENKSRGIILDSNGVCNVCREWDTVSSIFMDYNKLEKIFQERIELIRGKYPYDVIVGLSGGKDGSYLVYQLKKKYGLRILAITGDYYFMPNQFAKENLKRVVSQLGVDHKFESVPHELIKKIFRNFLLKSNNIKPCQMCSILLGCIGIIKIAIDNQVPLIMWGSDHGQLFYNIQSPLIKKQLLGYLSPYIESKAKNNMEKMIEYMRNEFNKLGVTHEEQKLFIPETPYLRDTTSVPQFLHYFLFHPYDEESIKQTLIKEIGWVRPSGDELRGHFDCALKPAVIAAESNVLPEPHLKFELSVDIRQGKLTREQALERLEHENKKVENTVENPYKLYEKWFDIPLKTFEKKIRRVKMKARLVALFSCAIRLLKKILSREK